MEKSTPLFLHFREDRLGCRSRIRRCSDGPPNHDVVGAVGDGFSRGSYTRLVAFVTAGRAHAGCHDLHRRAEVGIAVLSASAGNCKEVMDACERMVAFRPEIELLSARQRLYHDED